jgi:hypothetical protein
VDVLHALAVDFARQAATSIRREIGSIPDFVIGITHEKGVRSQQYMLSEYRAQGRRPFVTQARFFLLCSLNYLRTVPKHDCQNLIPHTWVPFSARFPNLCCSEIEL